MSDFIDCRIDLETIDIRPWQSFFPVTVVRLWIVWATERINGFSMLIVKCTDIAQSTCQATSQEVVSDCEFETPILIE